MESVQFKEEYARKLDSDDPLKEFRYRFMRTDERLIYLDGNSLGMLPLTTAGKITNEIQKSWCGDITKDGGICHHKWQKKFARLLVQRMMKLLFATPLR
jgi:kynureninase